MKIVQLTPSLSVSDQLEPQDLETVRAQGFKSLINNRPDGEAERQPNSASLAAAAERLGIAYRHLPVISGKVTDGDVASFPPHWTNSRDRSWLFCRTGTRSTTLWALSEAWHRDPDAILKTAAAAGYNLESLRPRLEGGSGPACSVDRRRRPAGPHAPAALRRGHRRRRGRRHFDGLEPAEAPPRVCRWRSSSRARRIIISRDGPWSAPACSAEPRPSGRWRGSCRAR